MLDKRFLKPLVQGSMALARALQLRGFELLEERSHHFLELFGGVLISKAAVDALCHVPEQ
ncbi:MAG: hypothetical protein IPK60_20680 [Sandaracinaceae bacterium]|nr:hypothetical protein [Sandaracinaceae bacterium]